MQLARNSGKTMATAKKNLYSLVTYVVLLSITNLLLKSEFWRVGVRGRN